MARQGVQHCGAVNMQSRKRLKFHPVDWYRPARSASASHLRNKYNIHGTLLVCRALYPMLTDSFRQQAVHHYPRGMKAAQLRPEPEKTVQRGTGHTAAGAATLAETT